MTEWLPNPTSNILKSIVEVFVFISNDVNDSNKKEIKISDQTCTDTDESTYAYFRERTFHSRYNENPQLEQVFAGNSSDEWFYREQWEKT